MTFQSSPFNFNRSAPSSPRRRVFFSFDYDDVFRANVVRNSQKIGVEIKGFFDHADREKIKASSDEKVKKWINEQMCGASVTVLLIGEKTHQSRWVKYEIQKSLDDRMGILGVVINRIRDAKDTNQDRGVATLFGNPQEPPWVRHLIDPKPEESPLASLARGIIEPEEPQEPSWAQCLVQPPPAPIPEFESIRWTVGSDTNFPELENHKHPEPEFLWLGIKAPRRQCFVYDWKLDDGYSNIRDWIERAYKTVSPPSPDDLHHLFKNIP